MRDSYQLIQLPPRPIPSAIPAEEEIFAIGDVHGRARALRSCLSEIASQPRTKGVRRTIIFLGDILDRGPASLEAVDLVVRARELARADEVHLLPGNYELMYADAIAGAPSLWLMNGGIDVMDEVDRDWRSLPWADAMRAVEARMPSGFTDLIRGAPSHLRIGDILFVHAGLDPYSAPDIHLDRHRPHADNDLHWAWIRRSFLEWSGGWTWEPVSHQYGWGDALVVHGHSPVITQPMSAGASSLAACDVVDQCRRVCLDAGSARLDQIAWAHFFRVEATTMMQISASAVIPLVDPSDLYF